jgi:predicted extracellular nuclease/endonuclease I
MTYTKLLPLLLATGLGSHAHADVFISEYIEGSGYNKAIEIYNSGTDSVSLNNYAVEIYSNGGTSANVSIALSGNLNAGATYVIGNQHADTSTAITSVSQLIANVNFNGDDTVMLKDGNSVLLDVIGKVGEDPGSRWSEAGVSTSNATIRRKPAIVTGDTNADDAFDPSIEWDAFASNTFDGLGTHTTDGSAPIDPPVDPVDPPSDGELITPCFNCPSLSPVADPSAFDANGLYGNIQTAIANLPADASATDVAQIKALINDAAQTNHNRLSYSQVWSALTATDEDPNNTDNVILIYSGRSIPKFSNGSGTQSTDQDNWNREHSWPKSRGFSDDSQIGYTDIHHLRPSDISVNSARGNKDFDISDNAIDEAPGSRVDGDSFEPRDEVKGDVARMMLYMDTRYEGESGENTPDLYLDNIVGAARSTALGKLCVLLAWSDADPIDEVERTRHDRIYQYQGNRNPYVDNPEWIDLIYPESTCDAVIEPPTDPVDPPTDPVDPPTDPVDPPASNNSPLILTTLFDGSLSGGQPKGIEIYVARDIPDLSVCGVGSANNGGGSDGQEFTFPAVPASAGTFITVAHKAAEFETYFGQAPSYTNNALAINGDDAIELFCNGEVVDLYGDIDTDGNGEVWEYLDSYAKRVNNTRASAVFNPDNWIFAGKNVLDGKDNGEEVGLGSFESVQAELFISEYVEGSGLNKIIELVNLTGRTIDLSEYTVDGYQNGNTSNTVSGGYSIVLEGMLADQSVFVLANSGADLPAISALSQSTGSLAFNGDDAVVLMKGGDVIDAIGQIGNRPSNGWGTDPTNTKDNTIRRKLSITSGDTDPSDAFDPAIQWDGFERNDLSDIGLYAGIDSGTNPIDVELGQCADPATLMHEVQGAGDATPLLNEQIVVEGVVTLLAEPLGGFFIQEEDSQADADSSTSEALFVYLDTLDMPVISEGDVLRVRGIAGEGFGKTQIVADAFSEVCGSAPMPLAVPVTSLLVEGSNYEASENMLMMNFAELIVAGTADYARLGEVVLSTERLYVPTHLHLPGSAEAIALAVQNENNQIILDDAQNGVYVGTPTTFGELSTNNSLRVGTTVSNSQFVMDYAFNNYRLRPVGNINYALAERPSAPSLDGNVKVASFNVLNLFNGDGNGEGFPTSRGAETQIEYEEQLDKIVEALAQLDASVIGLMEIENDGYGPESSIAQLVDALNIRYGDDAYAFVDAGEPEAGQDEISVGILYNKNVVSLAGDLEILNSQNSIADDIGPLFDTSKNRPSFAQMFLVNETDDTFVVNVNHLKSKGSSCGTGDDDTLTGQGSCNLTRTRAAQALHVWLGTTFTDEAILIVGDLNAYAQEDPITTLNAAGYVNVARNQNGPLAYSYTFGNQFGTLDYVLANPQAQMLISGATEWHINSDEPRVFEYSDTYFASSVVKPLEYADSSEYRSSDHDPIIVGMMFEEPGVLGDANNNGRLDYEDYFIIMRAVRGTRGSAVPYNSIHDLNDDGLVNRDDLTLWRALYRAGRRSGAIGR